MSLDIRGYFQFSVVASAIIASAMAAGCSSRSDEQTPLETLVSTPGMTEEIGQKQSVRKIVSAKAEGSFRTDYVKAVWVKGKSYAPDTLDRAGASKLAADVRARITSMEESGYDVISLTPISSGMWTGAVATNFGEPFVDGGVGFSQTAGVIIVGKKKS